MKRGNGERKRTATRLSGRCNKEIRIYKKKKGKGKRGKRKEGEGGEGVYQGSSSGSL